MESVSPLSTKLTHAPPGSSGTPRRAGFHGLQLLDDAVSLDSITLNLHDKNGRILVNYGFEFATNGAVRRNGTASLGFPRGFTVTLDLEEGRLIEKL